jgi:hypothetical protein
VQQLKKQKDKKQEWLQKGHGEYHFLTNEKEFFAAMKGEEKMVCHFCRDSWPCKIMDKHMATLCKQHLECKFAKVRPRHWLRSVCEASLVSPAYPPRSCQAALMDSADMPADSLQRRVTTQHCAMHLKRRSIDSVLI